MRRSTLPTSIAALFALTLSGCGDGADPLALSPGEVARQMAEASAPSSLVTVSAGGVTQDVWPFTGWDFSGEQSDPMNLVFLGATDPRSIRAALMSLDADRNVPAFTGLPGGFGVLLAGLAQGCRWTDAYGATQVGYSGHGGWEGSAIQLECGTYGGIRYHLRLFRAGEWTLANAHFEILIPGTHDHQVLSFEAGEVFVMAELARGGFLLAPPGQTGPINVAPTYRTSGIRPEIYNGLPQEGPLVALRLVTGGPLSGSVSTPVPIPSNGSATILHVREAEVVPGTTVQEFTLQYGQFIPKPFCTTDGFAVLRVDGPIHLRKEVGVSSSGALTSQASAEAELSVMAINPATGEQRAMRAEVKHQALGNVLDRHTHATNSLLQTLHGDGRSQQLSTQLQVGPNDRTRFTRRERC
jgi:hypothetical protein